MDEDDFVNELLESAPEHFDGDEGAEEIAVRYVRILEQVAEEAKRVAHPHTALKEALNDLYGTWED
jgi:hypothetical protein